MSINTSAIPMIREKRLKFKHRPGLVRCQKMSTGMHITMLATKSAMNQAVETIIMIRHIRLNTGVEKMRR